METKRRLRCHNLTGPQQVHHCPPSRTFSETSSTYLNLVCLTDCNYMHAAMHPSVYVCIYSTNYHRENIHIYIYVDSTEIICTKGNWVVVNSFSLVVVRMIN